eukprot:scaffold3764_cov50-Attheya_sp.AAC.3
MERVVALLDASLFQTKVAAQMASFSSLGVVPVPLLLEQMTHDVCAHQSIILLTPFLLLMEILILEVQWMTLPSLMGCRTSSTSSIGGESSLELSKRLHSTS